ncbi:MAG: serine/threonine protein kinase [Planctomycetaceae bacterium]|nr:serine/threonine protein kinase [Planctomycetaceae bacterium]
MSSPESSEHAATQPLQMPDAHDLAETVVPGDQGSSALQRTKVMSSDTSTGQKSSQPAPKTNPPKTTKASGQKTYVLGDFELRKELGQGGMGKVYLAHQISLDRDCALKVMSKELKERPGFVERFLREARSMAKLDHPHVVKCYAVGEERGKHYVAMELIDGQSMQDWIDEIGTLPIGDAVLITLVCAEALEHAHGLSMVHRDIKPDNILVTKTGLVKVADLGLAKVTDDDMSMTQTGHGLGTPHYMPPEQARDAKHVDARCDVYALGCTLYHFVTGALPFAGDSVVELITNKERGQFKPARQINKNVPERLSLIIDKMMARDPKHRYQSCEELIKDLEALNLANEALSFIQSEKKTVLRRGSSMPTQRVGGTQVNEPPASPRQQRSNPTASRKQTAASSPRQSQAPTGDLWYVKYEDSTGRIRTSKMTREQILQALKSDKLTLKTRVARSSKEEFVPVGQIPVFEAEANKAVTRIAASRRETNMANAYAKIEKQYNRQKWWRLIGRFRDGTLGIVGLIVWLVVALTVVGGGGFFLLVALKSYAVKEGWIQQ